MIRLVKVNKYFNRHKSNQIHAIDNTSLEFPDKGLVALLGPSGCGKTTLLNSIGGLDKVDSGKIYINGKRLPKDFSPLKDKIRTLNIGYIFQNYNLLDNMTVFDNIAISLKMIGIKDKKEIKEKVEYVLEKVDMYRYKNRLCSALSGGQRQRVGIARAIVKNPSVIIADEPTGNLDSKNTIEIMNIIKSISQEKLVILVTHEKELAMFYASRIINIIDGKVESDNNNDHNNELDYQIDDDIYLKDFKKHQVIKGNNCKINLYSDEEKELDLDIVLKNGNIYIQTKNDKIEVVDESSSIKFIDDKYKKINKKDYEKTNFDLNKLDNSNHRLRYASIYNIISSIVVGIKRLLGYSLIKKFLLLGFLASSMFILYAVSNIFGVTNIKDEDFTASNKYHIQVITNKGDFNTYNKLKDRVSYILPGYSNITFEVDKNDLYQFSQQKLSFEASISDPAFVSELIYGRMPENSKEVVIDKLIYDRVKKTSLDFTFSSINVRSYEELLGLKIKRGNLTYTIVGVSDLGSPCLYVSKDEFTNIISYSEERKYLDYSLSEGLTITKGRAPEWDYEIIVNESNKDSMKLDKEIDEKINDHKLRVVGYYSTPYNDNTYYVNKNTINIINITENKGFTIYTDAKEAVLEVLNKEGIKARDSYEYSKKEYKKDVQNNVRNTLIISGILILISFIEIYLMIRASFMSRIKEIGILRAIGIKKLDVYKMFAGEILVITTITGIPGVILMSYILQEISKISFLSGMFMINPLTIGLSIVLIYTFNMLVGLIPIWSVIRKTPAAILSRNDVD